MDSVALPVILTTMERRILRFASTEGIRLFQNEGNGKFSDVTAKVGIAREKGCVAATFVDYDHDGDLDLYLTMTPGSAEKRTNSLWRNNGNSTFTDVSEPTGLGVDATGAGIAVTDFNNDRAIDFILPADAEMAPRST